MGSGEKNFLDILCKKKDKTHKKIVGMLKLLSIQPENKLIRDLVQIVNIRNSFDVVHSRIRNHEELRSALLNFRY